MLNVTSLIGLLEANRVFARGITYLKGKHETPTCSFGALCARAGSAAPGSIGLSTTQIADNRAVSVGQACESA